MPGLWVKYKVGGKMNRNRTQIEIDFETRSFELEVIELNDGSKCGMSGICMSGACGECAP
jgi:hypothetical protein